MSGTTRWMAAGPLKDYLEKVSEENKKKAKICSLCNLPNANRWEAVRGTATLIRVCDKCMPEED